MSRLKHRAGNYNIYEHGVSVKYLSAFDHCRQEVQWLGEGWRKRIPNFAASYGTFSHLILEQVYKDIRAGKIKKPPDEARVKLYAAQAEKTWRKERGKRAPAAMFEQLEMSMAMLEAVLPEYFKFWWDDFQDLKLLHIEDSFEIPWKLSDGKFTHLFGYIDLAFGYTDKKIWILDTKNKGRITLDTLHSVLPRDLQLNLYLYAIWKMYKKMPGGAWYNIVRRPQLKPKKGEDLPMFARRIREDVKDRPEFYFIRIELPCDKTSMLQFEHELRDRIEEFYRWWLGIGGHWKNPRGCEMSWGLCDFSDKCDGNNGPYERRPRPPVRGDAVELIA